MSTPIAIVLRRNRRPFAVRRVLFVSSAPGGFSDRVIRQAAFQPWRRSSAEPGKSAVRISLCESCSRHGARCRLPPNHVRGRIFAMAAWLVVTATLKDRDAFMACGYSHKAATILEQHGGRYVIRAPGATVLEGEGAEGASVVVSEWPSREAALGFYNSPEYTEAKKLREGLAEINVTLVGA